MRPPQLANTKVGRLAQGHRITIEPHPSPALPSVAFLTSTYGRFSGVHRGETVAEYPPTAVLVELAQALQVSADELLGLKSPTPAGKVLTSPKVRRLWKEFQQVLALREKDRRAVIRLINSLVAAQKR